MDSIKYSHYAYDQIYELMRKHGVDNRYVRSRLRRWSPEHSVRKKNIWAATIKKVRSELAESKLTKTAA